MIQAIYVNRKFVVSDGGNISEEHTQYGICQGCPLSPFLFVMVMSVLLHDAKIKVQSIEGIEFSTDMLINDLVYADDTLLIDVDANVLETFMNCIAEVGKEYGMSFNWSKLEMLPIRMSAQISRPDGEDIKTKDSMLYLGSLLAADGRITSELARRLGMAHSDFQLLDRIWRHSTLNRSKKIRIFDACICTKLCYGLFTATLTAKEKQRIDGFQARCLRKILGIAPAYYSRISNQIVRTIAGERRLSDKLTQQQVRYLSKLASRDDDDPTRTCIFERGCRNLLQKVVRRKPGRPRVRWATEAHKAWKVDNDDSNGPIV